MRIRFTVTPKLPRDLAHLAYTVGTEVDVRDDEADKWLNRGVAEIIPAEQPTEPQDEPQVADTDAEPRLVVDIPDDWESQHHMSRIALARRLTTEAVETAADAAAVIMAEIESRTRPA